MIEVMAYRIYTETGWITPDEKIEAETVRELKEQVRERAREKIKNIDDKEVLLITRETKK